MTITTTSFLDTDLRCSLVSDPAQLEALRPSWLDLLERSGGNEIMQTPLWLLPWWKVYGNRDGRQLRIGLFHDGEQLVGLAPLLVRRHWYRPGLPFRRLELLGSGERHHERIWSDYLGLLVERGSEERVISSFVRAIQASVFGSWDELVFSAMDGNQPLPELLTQTFRAAGYQAQCFMRSEAPYAPLPDSWEAYLKGLSSSHRYFIKRSIRDFERWAEGDFQVLVAGSPEELEEGKRHLVSLHTERWQAAGGPGAFESARVQAFHDLAQRELLEAGALDLLWLRARGEVLAVLYNLRWNGKVSHYQAGRRTDLPAAIRPGVVLNGYAIQRAIAAGLREYDFLAGVSRYKRQFAPETRPLVEVRVTPRSLRESTLRLIERSFQAARTVRDGMRRLGRSLRTANPSASAEEPG